MSPLARRSTDWHQKWLLLMTWSSYLWSTTIQPLYSQCSVLRRAVMGGNTVDAFIMIDYNVDCDNHPIIVHIPTMHVQCIQQRNMVGATQMKTEKF